MYISTHTDTFDFNGVKQGDPLLPHLFIFFINDMINNIELDSDLDVFYIDNLPLFALMYADDAVIFLNLKLAYRIC